MYYDPLHLKYWRKHQIQPWIRNLAYLILTHQSQVETLTLQIKGNYPGIGASQVTLVVKNRPAVWETWIRSLGWEDPLNKSMATPSSILAWRIPMDRGTWWATVHRTAKKLDMIQ